MQSDRSWMMRSNRSWMIPIEGMLGSLTDGEIQVGGISSVPDEIREPNNDAFKPKVISIGPLHRGITRHLQLMEGPKFLYMREFLERSGSQEETSRSLELTLKDCGIGIDNLQKEISASYGGNIQSEPHELAKIMIVDGCFLLEFLIRLGNYMEPPRYHKRNYSDDPILKNEGKVVPILNDITMLENQIPFIVLKELYRNVFPPASGTTIEDDHRVADIVRKAFGYSEENKAGGAHIVHLMHLSTVDQNQQESTPVKQELMRCATRLQAAGVTIKGTHKSSPHRLVDWFNFNIYFNKDTLEITPLCIKETTEVRWRNLIAWEQSRIWMRCKYTSYALFFQGLICCKHDIELLEEKGVIVNEGGKSKEELLTLFRTISKGAEYMDSSNSEICARLNEYRERKFRRRLQELCIITWHQWRGICETIVYYWGNWYKILIRDHIPTVWKFIGVLAGAALLVLSIMQTYYSSRGGG